MGPLALSFDKKVAFYTKWKYLFPAMILPVLFYLVWDAFFTAKGVWGFNPDYITGIYLYNLPLEEVLFFVVVPYCCLFVYECIRCYFPKIRCTQTSDVILGGMGLLLLIVGLIFFQRYYTSWTFVFNAAFIGWLLWKRSDFTYFNSAVFLIAYAIILVPFLLVNGFLTAVPVVVYNDAENLGIRIYTIPFEDMFYGMLLILMIVVLYEKARNGSNKSLQ